MADFKTHITTSTILGVGYGIAGALFYDVPLPAALIGTGLCSVSGMLPDIDSDSGVPLRESLAFGAAVVPMMLAERLRNLGMSHESILLAGAATYLFIRFVFAAILKHYTVHRGMFHSIPAMVIWSELAYLLAAGDVSSSRWFQAIAVTIGFASHLILDEIWAIDLRGGHIRFKSSFGTAIKFFGPSLWSNCTTYAKLAILTFAMFEDPNVVSDMRQDTPAVANQPAPAPQQPQAPAANPNASAQSNPVTWLRETAEKLQEQINR